MRSMDSYSMAAVERAMKVHEVILRALAKRITRWQAAEIISISDSQMLGWHQRYEAFGYEGSFDSEIGRPSLGSIVAEEARFIGMIVRLRYSGG